MPFPTYAVSTELDAVNQILSSVGQAPVTTLNLENPEVAIALNTLRECSRMVQTEGWTFNYEEGVEVTPDSVSKEITFNVNWLTVDPVNNAAQYNLNVVKRNGKLYDKASHKYTFDDPLEVNILWHFDFPDVPPAIQQYITARAARMCATKMIGDKEVQALLQEQEAMTRANCLEYECTQGDYSFFGFENGKNHYQSFLPADALRR